MNKKISIFLLFCLIFIFSFGETVNIKIVKSANGVNNYVGKLLSRSLKDLGYDFNITYTDETLGGERGFAAVIANQADIFWSGNKNKDTDKIFHLDIPITENLLGKRILFIPKGDTYIYQNVKSLDDLKKLNKVGGFGRGWSDTKIWEKNNIPYHEKQNGNWEALYLMIAKKTRGIDYFSRGVIEILPEKKGIIDENNIALEIEPNLLFQYNLDYVVYLNKQNKEKNKIIEEALLHAKNTDIMANTVYEYWKNDFETLNVTKRRVIVIPN